jgi:predicted SAM-dependent methyltransferase
MKLLNLGCGSRFHPDWINMDWSSCNAYVKVHDLSTGIPFPDSTFDVVYHSHLLEHLQREKAFFLVQECYRVLKVGGIIRIAVPDLEQIVRMYLVALEKALQGNHEWGDHYDWMMLELYDQAVREIPGGAMRVYLEQRFIPNEGFVCERMGCEARRIIQSYRARANREKVQHSKKFKLFASFQSILLSLRERLLREILTDVDYKALKLGQFRLSGEVHQWMYDRYSLGKLLSKAGFENVKSVGPGDSQIPHWSDYCLDTEPDGTVYKPDSFYMEARRSVPCP